MVAERDLALLEDWIRRIKIEYEIYFAGNRRTAPHDLKNKIESTIKRFYDSPSMNFADRYRFSTLADRYNAYRDLWRRQLQRLEEQGRMRAGGAAVDTPVSKPGRLQVDLSNPEQEEQQVEKLFDFYCQTRREYEGVENLNISLDQFQRFVSNKTAELKQKYQSEGVIFQVRVDDGSVKLTAKARRRKQEGPTKDVH